jgi:hypothetical protein
MKIFIVCSKHFYGRIAEIKTVLEQAGHCITMPNSYDEPMQEERMKNTGAAEHAAWKAMMLKRDAQNVGQNDAVLVLNFEKKGQQNYIGGATFLEIAKAFELGKKIYLYNPVPDNIFKDELLGMQPTVINGNLGQIKQ